MSISMLTIDQCFSAPQNPKIKSKSLGVTVKTQGETLNIGLLKQHICAKGYPGLSDPSCITLIIPAGSGTILHNHTMASSIPTNSNILALVLQTPSESTRLHSDNGNNLPPILFVYTVTSLKTYIKFPQTILSDSLATWSQYHLTWNVTLQDLTTYFTSIGFNHDMVVQCHHYEACLSSTPAGSSRDVNLHHQGYLASRIMVRLWDAAGINRLIAAEDYGGTACQSEFEVRSVLCFSVDSVSSTSTVQVAQYAPRHTGRSLTPMITPSIRMASPSEHESAYDEAFYQTLNQVPRTATTASSQTSRSARSQISYDHNSTASSGFEDDDHDQQSMDWTTNTARQFATSSQVSYLIRKVQKLTRQRDQIMEESERLKECQSLPSISNQLTQYAQERLALTNQIDNLNQENSHLKEEFRAEAQTVEALLLSFSDLQTEDHSTRANIRREVESIHQDLPGVISCPICFERYGSLSSNRDMRPIHLSCGHIFCATCLDTDRRTRFDNGHLNPYCCFNRCTNVDPGSLGEVYLLEDVKSILNRLASY